MKMNNVSVMCNGYKVSIAQHYDGDDVVCEEIGYMQGGEWIIEPFHGDLSGLIDSLCQIEGKLKENNNA